MLPRGRKTSFRKELAAYLSDGLVADSDVDGVVLGPVGSVVGHHGEHDHVQGHQDEDQDHAEHDQGLRLGGGGLQEITVVIYMFHFCDPLKDLLVKEC